MLGDGFRAPGKGPWKASSRPERRELWPWEPRLASACVKAGPILRQALVEHGVKKSTIFATHSLGYAQNILGANCLSERTTAGKLSTQSGLQIRLQVPGNSVARVVFEDGFLISQFSPQFLHFRI